MNNLGITFGTFFVNAILASSYDKILNYISYVGGFLSGLFCYLYPKTQTIWLFTTFISISTKPKSKKYNSYYDYSLEDFLNYCVINCPSGTTNSTINTKNLCQKFGMKNWNKLNAICSKRTVNYIFNIIDDKYWMYYDIYYNMLSLFYVL